ncbi:sugar-transfer associated ATP-grasp domain-containing protein [Halegenticoccus soli]|uniref:sugar-transfer associated ATP-grasp domain-containing protein n=1 Tax=Halegenticoccus soli TaxID=1985678 RepID=UPI000C6CF78C|nr:sugar-transfer associated ATP-grasp domain-containing protein [Halegenticoccus soli]
MNANQTVERAYRAATRRALPSLRRRLREVRNVVEVEAATISNYPMPLRRRLWLWRHGFQSRNGALYDLDAHDPSQYLTDRQIERTPLINGRWRTVFENKLVFHWMMRAFPANRPAVHCALREGHAVPIGPPAASEREGVPATDESSGTTHAERGAEARGDPIDAAAWFAREVSAGDRFVLKPIFGGFGDDVHICSKTDDGYVVGGDPKTPREFAEFVSDLDGYLVSEFARQADYVDAIFPDAANTLRVITMWDVDADEPFVPIAAHRIGTSHSAPLDNWSQGGMMAEVDVETGELGPAAPKPSDGMEWYARHPETGAQIEGVRIPGWEEIRERTLEITASLPQAPYAGWDAIVTGEGEFVIIEGNNKPGLQAMQAYWPLLTDRRVRRFFEHHDVL